MSTKQRIQQRRRLKQKQRRRQPQQHPQTIDADDDDGGPPGPRFLTKAQVMERIHISGPTIWLWMRQGKFPRSRVVANKSMCARGERVDGGAANSPAEGRDRGRAVEAV
jgi:hypothetical protein